MILGENKEECCKKNIFLKFKYIIITTKKLDFINISKQRSFNVFTIFSAVGAGAGKMFPANKICSQNFFGPFKY